MMIDYQPLYRGLHEAGVESWVEQLPLQLQQAFDNMHHGNLGQWKLVVEQIEELTPSIRELACGVKVGVAADISESRQLNLEKTLKKLHPWRKGPYHLFGIHVDTEWRSDWKWQRLKDHISPLKNRMVLDVGCGNGYHCWRMLAAGARLVVGIDPYLLNVMQFHAIRKLYGEAPVYVLPLRLEDVPAGIGIFNTVFSMGVLYHRRSPIDHLLELKACLHPGGELVLETLIIEGREGEVLLPPGRYASMRNVWFLPSCDTLISWMLRCGFSNVRVLDISKTTLEEQRTTEWMPFHSLKDFIDPDNMDLSCEGLPAPIRAIFTANLA
jgi:tRNA (mo5U34)-methyltransferase